MWHWAQIHKNWHNAWGCFLKEHRVVLRILANADTCYLSFSLIIRETHAVMTTKTDWHSLSTPSEFWWSPFSTDQVCLPRSSASKLLLIPGRSASCQKPRPRSSSKPSKLSFPPRHLTQTSPTRNTMMEGEKNRCHLICNGASWK